MNEALLKQLYDDYLAAETKEEKARLLRVYSDTFNQELERELGRKPNYGAPGGIGG